jgi:hypothetical protein
MAAAKPLGCQFVEYVARLSERLRIPSLQA